MSVYSLGTTKDFVRCRQAELPVYLLAFGSALPRDTCEVSGGKIPVGSGTAREELFYKTHGWFALITLEDGIFAYIGSL
jgi:hypothetical protein